MREILFRGKRVDNGEWVEGAFSSHSWNYFGEREEKTQIIVFSEIEDFDGLRFLNGGFKKGSEWLSEAQVVEGGYYVKNTY